MFFQKRKKPVYFYRATGETTGNGYHGLILGMSDAQEAFFKTQERIQEDYKEEIYFTTFNKVE